MAACVQEQVLCVMAACARPCERANYFTCKGHLFNGRGLVRAAVRAKRNLLKCQMAWFGESQKRPTEVSKEMFNGVRARTPNPLSVLVLVPVHMHHLTREERFTRRRRLRASKTLPSFET